MPIRRLIERNWHLEPLRLNYERFFRRFLSIYRDLEGELKFDRQQSFVIRTPAVHDYRRILLEDPTLPMELLPDAWPGRQALILFRHLFRLIPSLLKTMSTPSFRSWVFPSSSTNPFTIGSGAFNEMMSSRAPFRLQRRPDVVSNNRHKRGQKSQYGDRRK